MLALTNLVGGAAGGHNVPASQLLINAITTAGLTTNLQLCLDAADSASYNGNDFAWRDRSGNGYDFLLGNETATSSADPTWQGTHFNFDGGDKFTYDAANETWMQNLHKNNAIVSAIFFAYGSSTTTARFFGTSGFGSGPGFSFEISGTGSPEVVAFWTTTGNALVAHSTALPTTAAWHMIGFSLNEATGPGGGFFYVDGAYSQSGGSDTFNSTYSTPAAANAATTMQVGDVGGGALPSPSGNSFACAAIWGGTAITKANMDTIWAAMRGRFGI